jgi:DUF1365 family protein
VGVEPQLFFGKVMHGRLFPKRNNFTYGIYYLSLPLSQIKALPIAYNRFAPLSFYDRDHGHCDGQDLQKWARGILADHSIKEADGDITLVCMARVFGYVFNPVSFWLCHDKQGALRTVLCEVHNTFGEKHTYICAHDDHRPITTTDILSGEKAFHVSPLLKREGHYNFRFDAHDDKFAVWIDFYDSTGKKQLMTSLIGQFEPMTAATLRKAFWRYPLVTFKAITLIHWQALKLLSKGIKYISRPSQKPERVSKMRNLTKM